MSHDLGLLCGLCSDRPLDVRHPVELLRDKKGVYGVGIAEEAAFENSSDRVHKLILRPDRLSESSTACAALQMITGGFRNGIFWRTSEERLRQVIHHEMLRRNGLAWPPRDDTGYETWWSADQTQKKRNRRTYHGTRLASLAVVNSLIGQALGAADGNALALSRRFPINYRFCIYRATAQSRRALQLTEAFPALGFAIYAGWRTTAAGAEASRLVESGAAMKTVADSMRIPMVFRKVKPGAAKLALDVADAIEDPRLLDAWMPESLPKMKHWLRCLRDVTKIGSEFVHWTGEHVHQIPGSTSGACNVLADIGDWVVASYRSSMPPHVIKALLGNVWGLGLEKKGEQFVTRRFSPDMGVATVLKLSHEWHEVIAANMSGPECKLPDSWCPAGEYGGFSFLPLTSSSELYREGKLMHHCAGTYIDRIRGGACCLFSIRREGERIATLELVRNGARAALGQVRGPCNSQPSKAVLGVARAWLRSQREFRFPLVNFGLSATSHPIDDDIPF